MKFSIYEGNMERLEKKLLRIQNKCKKYGSVFTYKKIGEEFKDIKCEDGKIRTLRFVIIEAEGKAIMNDWEFIGKIEHESKGNIIKKIKDIPMPEKFLFCNPWCEHCKKRKNRRYTYIVRNLQDGELKQVGKSCLAEFTHGLDAEVAAGYISAYDELIQGENIEPGSGYRNYIGTLEALEFVSETVRHFGYIKADNIECRPTKDRAWEYITCSHNSGFGFGSRFTKDEMLKIGFDEKSDYAVKEAAAAMEWISNQEVTTEYIHNLKMVCGMEYIEYKNFGILASLIPTYKRWMENEKERIAKEEARKAQNKMEIGSVYVGNVKERITLDISSVEVVASYCTDYGYMYINKIIGTDGNVYIWKTGKRIDEDAKTIVGTVKDHNEYNGIKQTELTRCKISA